MHSMHSIHSIEINGRNCNFVQQSKFIIRKYSSDMDYKAVFLNNINKKERKVL